MDDDISPEEISRSHEMLTEATDILQDAVDQILAEVVHESAEILPAVTLSMAIVLHHTVNGLQQAYSLAGIDLSNGPGSHSYVMAEFKNTYDQRVMTYMHYDAGTATIQ